MSEVAAVSGPRHVLVGVDGSEESAGALRWALRYAEAFDLPVVALSVWHYPVTAGYAPIMGFDPEQDAWTVLKNELAKVVGGGDEQRVSMRVRSGPPAQVLVEESRAAALLVVGSRGLGAFGGMLLGSVSSYCSHHASCSLVIVRPDA